MVVHMPRIHKPRICESERPGKSRLPADLGIPPLEIQRSAGVKPSEIQIHSSWIDRSWAPLRQAQ